MEMLVTPPHVAPPTSTPALTRRGARQRGHRPRIQERRSPKSGTVFLYGDFRQFADVGGRVEPLRAPGERYATSDPATAARLYAERIALYQARRDAAALGRSAELVAPAQIPRFAEMVELHLARKAAPRSGIRASTIRRDRINLRVLQRHLGNCRLDELTPERLDAYVLAREQEPGCRTGSRVAAHTILNELHSLSNLCRRAVAMRYLPDNPVQRMAEKPRPAASEAEFLTAEEAGRLLDAAAELDEEARRAQLAARLRKEAKAAGDARRNARARALRREAARAEGTGPRHPNVGRAYHWLEVLVATLLYTGGRLQEVAGLLVEDLDFVQMRVHFRPNQYRDLKRPRHRRKVEMWPPLAALLRHYLRVTGRKTGLLFPGQKGGPMPGIHKQLARCFHRAKLTGRRLSPHALRHTYATMLLQTMVPTVEGGYAVRSSFDVARRLGHQSSALVDAVYGHLVTAPRYARTLTYEPYRKRPVAPVEARPTSTGE